MKKIVKIIILISIINLLIACNQSYKETYNTITDNQKKEVKATIKETIKPIKTLSKTPNYKIIKTLDNERIDGGNDYFVLIDQVNLNKEEYKSYIKLISNELAKIKGIHNNFFFFDSKSDLELMFKDYPNNQRKINVENFIASFSGAMKNDSNDINTITFLLLMKPETIEYNPK